MPDPVTREIFIPELRRVFAFLCDHGFEFREDTIRDRPTFLSAAYCGRNIAFVFTIDRIEELLECHIERVSDGQIVNAAAPGGYRRSLGMYLISVWGHRRIYGKESLRGGAPLREKIVSVLDSQAEVIRTHAKMLLADDADLLR